MSRFPATFLAGVLLALVLAPVPMAEATHEWGHRYMVYGRILDADGNPLQNKPVSVTVETTKPQDPVIVIPTDCQGIYYTLKQEGNPYGGDIGLEGPVMHIHAAELPSTGKWTATTEYGTKSAQVRGDMHRSTGNFQVDSVAPPDEACAGMTPWTTQYIVQGRVQREDGPKREDMMTLPQYGIQIDVDVTLTTENGVKNMTVQTNGYGDYVAVFDNVTVKDGAAVTSKWEGESRSGKVDAKYRMSEVNIIAKEQFGSGAGMIFLYIIGGIIVIGVAVWGYGKVRSSMELKRIQGSTTRKRSN